MYIVNIIIRYFKNIFIIYILYLLTLELFWELIDEASLLFSDEEFDDLKASISINFSFDFFCGMFSTSVFLELECESDFLDDAFLEHIEDEDEDDVEDFLLLVFLELEDIDDSFDDAFELNLDFDDFLDFKLSELEEWDEGVFGKEAFELDFELLELDFDEDFLSGDDEFLDSDSLTELQL